MTTATGTNRQRYDQAFMDALDLQPEDLAANLSYNSVRSWDSVGHMLIISALEGEFDIVLNTKDILDFSSYRKGVEILANYGVRID